MALLSFRTKFSGPIRSLNEKHLRQEDPQGLDIIDETIYYFRSNMFFANYEIKCDADRNIVYLTLYLIECLKVIARATNRNAAAQELTNLALAKFALPGEPRFPLNNMYQKASNSMEAGELVFIFSTYVLMFTFVFFRSNAFVHVANASRNIATYYRCCLA